MGHFTIHRTQQGKMLASLPQFECSLLPPTKEPKMALNFCFVVMGVYALEGFYP